MNIKLILVIIFIIVTMLLPIKIPVSSDTSIRSYTLIEDVDNTVTSEPEEVVKPLFSERELKELTGVDGRLVLLLCNVKYRLQNSDVIFVVIDGVRELKEQQVYLEHGSSQTLNSKHLIGKAFDIMIYIKGKPTWEPEYYIKLNETFKEESDMLGLKIRWGGDWKTLKDYGHYEIVD